MTTIPLRDDSDCVALEHCDLCGSRHLQDFVTRWDGRPLVKCEICGVVFVNPQPPGEEILRWYDEEYYGGHRDFYRHKDYMEVTQWMIRARTGPGVDRFRRSIDPRSQRLLEVGCGYGAFLVTAREMGAQVQGIEVSPHAAEVGRREFSLDIVDGPLEEARFPAASFDIVTFFDVLEHMPSPTRFLIEVRRVLRPGGALFFLVPNLARYDLEGPRWPGLRYHPEHLFYYRLASLRPWLQRLGFQVQRHWTEGVGHEPTAGSAPPPGQPPHPLRQVLKRIPGLALAARGGRALWNGEVLEQWRAARGYGHNLIVLAARTPSP